jgi:hypothetical protein
VTDITGDPLLLLLPPATAGRRRFDPHKVRSEAFPLPVAIAFGRA